MTTNCPKCKEGILKGGTGLILCCPKCRAEFDTDLNYIRTTKSKEELQRQREFWFEQWI